MPALSSSLLANKKISAANTMIGSGISTHFGGFNSFAKTIFAFFIGLFLADFLCKLHYLKSIFLFAIFKNVLVNGVINAHACHSDNADDDAQH